MEIKLENATLLNIANGALAEQFDDALAQVASVFAEATSRVDCPYEAPKDVVSVKVPIDVVFEYSMETHTIVVSARLGVKLPKRRLSMGSVYHKGHEWSVAPEGEQTSMFGADVKSIRREAQADGAE